MQLDKDNKFNFFKQTNSYTRHNRLKLDKSVIISIVIFSGLWTALVYTPSKSVRSTEQVIASAVMDAQNSNKNLVQSTYVNTSRPTFVITAPEESFENISHKNRFNNWVTNQEPGLYIIPSEVQQIVKMTAKPSNKSKK